MLYVSPGWFVVLEAAPAAIQMCHRNTFCCWHDSLRLISPMGPGHHEPDPAAYLLGGFLGTVPPPYLSSLRERTSWACGAQPGGTWPPCGVQAHLAPLLAGDVHACAVVGAHVPWPQGMLSVR